MVNSFSHTIVHNIQYWIDVYRICVSQAKQQIKWLVLDFQAFLLLFFSNIHEIDIVLQTNWIEFFMFKEFYFRSDDEVDILRRIDKVFYGFDKIIEIPIYCKHFSESSSHWHSKIKVFNSCFQFYKSITEKNIVSFLS